MFFIKQQKPGVWKVIEVSDYSLQPRQLMDGHRLRKDAEIQMLVEYYSWPTDLARFTVENHLSFNFADAVILYEKRMKKRVVA